MENSTKTQFSGSEAIIVLHGDDKLAVHEDITKLIGEVTGFTELNTSRIDGSDITHNEISLQINMLPMGSDKRKVILEHAQDIFKNKSDQKLFQDILKDFSPTTQLILILDDEKKYQDGRVDWIRFKKSHWLRGALRSFPGETFWGEHPLPDAKTMPQWILDKARALGGNFHPAAAHALANLVGSDLFQAQQEIEKAIAFVGGSEQVSADIVHLLCAASQEESIFSLVDAVGARDGKTATRLFREMSIDTPAPYIFSMLVRQIRLLLQTSIVMEEQGSAKDVTRVCEIRSEWQANKLINQARRFTTKELKAIYRRLDHLDEDSKTGRVSVEPAIETLLVTISAK